MIEDPIQDTMRIQHVLTKKYGIKNETDKRWYHSFRSYSPLITISEPTYDDFLKGNVVLKKKLLTSQFFLLAAQPSIGIIIKTGEDEYLFVPSKPQMLKLLNRM